MSNYTLTHHKTTQKRQINWIKLQTGDPVMRKRQSGKGMFYPVLVGAPLPQIDSFNTLRLHSIWASKTLKLDAFESDEGNNINNINNHQHTITHPYLIHLRRRDFALPFLGEEKAASPRTSKKIAPITIKISFLRLSSWGSEVGWGSMFLLLPPLLSVFSSIAWRLVVIS